MIIRTWFWTACFTSGRKDSTMTYPILFLEMTGQNMHVADPYRPVICSVPELLKSRQTSLSLSLSLSLGLLAYVLSCTFFSPQGGDRSYIFPKRILYKIFGYHYSALMQRLGFDRSLNSATRVIESNIVSVYRTSLLTRSDATFSAGLELKNSAIY